MWSIATFYLTSLGNSLPSTSLASGTVLTQNKSNIVGNWHHTERSRFLLEKVFIILFNQHWLRFWHNRWKRSFNLTVITVTLGWALLVDAICWNLLAWKPLHHVKEGFVEEGAPYIKWHVDEHSKKFISLRTVTNKKTCESVAYLRTVSRRITLFFVITLNLLTLKNPRKSFSIQQAWNKTSELFSWSLLLSNYRICKSLQSIRMMTSSDNCWSIQEKIDLGTDYNNHIN